jgi:hypothetical protein
MRKEASRAMEWLVSGAGFCAGFLLIFWVIHQPPVSPPITYFPPDGREVGLVLLVDSGCAWSSHPELPPAWEELVAGMRQSSWASDAGVTTIGVARSPDPLTGWSLLEAIGEFDEVSTGGRYSNAYLRYFENDFRGPSSTPQVVVIEREFGKREDGTLHRTSERVVQRHFGIAGIRSAAGRFR